MAKSTQDQAAVTRHKIIDVAFKISVEKGFEFVTLGELAKAVSITRSGGNCHFKKQEAEDCVFKCIGYATYTLS